MADRARDLESKALDLPPEERARLAERLLARLEGMAEPEAEVLWLVEAERRLAELESGAAVGAPADEVFRKSRSALH
jgi:putative addiction module component (TIGR02574 family)